MKQILTNYNNIFLNFAHLYQKKVDDDERRYLINDECLLTH